MGKKWGSNADIHIGDIFRCYTDCMTDRPEYYQVVALRGRTQVVLHAIRSETYTNEGIAEDSPLYWRRVRNRPLPGQFMTEDDMWVIYEYRKRGKTIRVTGEEAAAWVQPCRTVDGRLQLQEIGELQRRLGIVYAQEFPKDWEPWDAETIRKLEEYDRQCTEATAKHLNGDEEAPWPEYPI